MLDKAANRLKISVVIPTYNSEEFIETTLKSVLSQTIKPAEILVLDDGSADRTVSILEKYKPGISIFQQKNRGVAAVRNGLCAMAQGDLIAFLDHDDVWHPKYLEIQSKLFQQHPEAVAYFAGHFNFLHDGAYNWQENVDYDEKLSEIIPAVEFFERYNHCPGPFGSMSFCCIPKFILRRLGPEPFPVEISGADDFYLMNRLALHGPTFFTSASLVAYRETVGSISANQLASATRAVRVFELLESLFVNSSQLEMINNFRRAFASKRRYLAKFLMGIGQHEQARAQLRASIRNCYCLASLLKSYGLLLSTYAPRFIQPAWPAQFRNSEYLSPLRTVKPTVTTEN